MDHIDRYRQRPSQLGEAAVVGDGEGVDEPPGKGAADGEGEAVRWG